MFFVFTAALEGFSLTIIRLSPLTLIGELRSLIEKAATAFKLSLWTYADASPTMIGERVDGRTCAAL